MQYRAINGRQGGGGGAGGDSRNKFWGMFMTDRTEFSDKLKEETLCLNKPLRRGHKTICFGYIET